MGALDYHHPAQCGHKLDYLSAKQRDFRREVTPHRQPRSVRSGLGVLAADPTPSHAALLAETVEQILAGLEEYQRDIFGSDWMDTRPARLRRGWVSPSGRCSEF